MKKVIILSAILLTLMMFQNCGGDFSQLDDQTSTVDLERAQNLPFAFESSIDHIGYMSCESDTLNLSPIFFNFKAGAYNSGSGLELRKEFRDHANKFRYTKNDLNAFIDNSKRNSGTGVAMSVRRSYELRAPLSIGNSNDPNSSLSSIGKLAWNQVSGITLTNNDIFSYLWNQKRPVSFLPMLQGVSPFRNFEGEIKFSGSYGLQRQVRSAVESDSLLTFTFGTSLAEDAQAAEGTYAVATQTPNNPVSEEAATSVFGKGYKFSFTQYNISRQSSPRSVVNGVSGFALETGNPLDEEWVCPPDERYIIVKDLKDALRRYDSAPEFLTVYRTIKYADGSTASTNEQVMQPNQPWYKGGEKVRFKSRANTAEQDQYYDAVAYCDGTHIAGTPGNPDGSCNPSSEGGYYLSYRGVKITDPIEFDHDGEPKTLPDIRFTAEPGFVRHKVLCPPVPDFPDFNDPEDMASWERIRNLLPYGDWYVYRGGRYNCIVPKKETTNACYGSTYQIINGIQQNFLSLPIKYLPDEDFPDSRIRLRLNETVYERQDPPRNTNIDCNSFSNGNNDICPQVFSVCYKKP